jgi:hypothetical protein
MRLFFAKLGYWIIGILLTLALLEGALRLLPVSMGLHRTERADQWPLQNYEPGLPYTYSTTWAMLNAQRGKTNNYGHIAPINFDKDSRPIVVIGDSYIESLMNPYVDTLQGQLGKMVGSRAPVYGLGVSGLSASDYMVIASQAQQEFKPQAAIFLITDGDFSESLSGRPGNYWLQVSEKSLVLRHVSMPGESVLKKIRKTVGESALYRYLQANLGFSPQDVLRLGLPAGRAVKNVEWQRRVVDWFLADLPHQLALPPRCIVFLVDSDRYALYDQRLASVPKDDPEVRQYFIDQASAQGFKIADLKDIFTQEYRRIPQKFDYWPNDRHWNRRGHEIAANEAYRLLITDPVGSLCQKIVARSAHHDPQ